MESRDYSNDSHYSNTDTGISRYFLYHLGNPFMGIWSSIGFCGNDYNEEQSDEELSCEEDEDQELPACRFFALGKCKFGEACTFSHDVASVDGSHGESKADISCQYYLSGNCRYGDNCKLQHNEKELAQEVQRTKNDDFVCGICFDDMKEGDKLFGLLKCDHCFCLDCLRTWRSSKTIESDVIRSCPQCRKISDFIVPSKRFCTGVEKKAVIRSYKKNLAGKPCKYFSGVFGSCPFGKLCFYAHLDSHGKDIKSKDILKKRKMLKKYHFDVGYFDHILHFFEFEDWLDANV